MNPLWIALAALLLLTLLARWAHTYPHRPLVIVAGCVGLLSLILLWQPSWLGPLLVVDAVALVAAAGDFISLARRKHFSAERSLGTIASLAKPHPVELTITSRHPRQQALWIRDALPDELVAEPDELVVLLPGRSRATLHYRLRAARRGAFTLDSVFVRVRSRWGFWQRIVKLPAQSRVHVYPDMQQLAEYALLARTNRLSLMGVRRTRKVGQDNEFERLRDYSRDDNYRHIDWRSTARRQKLTVKDFQANQSQRLFFLIDCGRMMTSQADGVSLLDHALNAMLMLSFVALRQGDQVGLMCFSDAIHMFLPPRGGLNQMNHLLHGCFDRFPSLVESRYDDAFLHLATQVRKRTLIVLMTNVIDEVNAHSVHRHLATLSGRHLPLGVLLRDHRLFHFAEPADEPLSADDPRLFTTAAAAQIITWRRQVLADLQTKGVLCLDVYPEQLTAPLVNRYLEIKARHLL